MKERPLRIFVDPQKISKHLYCSICHEVFDQPNRLGCGHTFCYLCIQQWAKLSKVCPLCKKSLRHRRPQKDLIAASLIDEMQVKCSHQKCQWTGVYSSLRKHQRKCDFRERKTVEKRNFDDIVELNDDEQIMKEGKNQGEKNGRKMLKRDHQDGLLPMFPQSEGQQLGVFNNLTDHAPWNLIQTLQNNQNFSSSSSNINSQSISNQSSSNSSNSSLSLNLVQLIQNRPLQFLHRLSQGQQDGEYFYKPCKKENQREHINLDKQQKPNVASNYFIIEKNKKQEEKQQKMLQQQKEKNNKWGLRDYINMQKQVQQEMEKQSEDSLSSSSNPFDEPIIEIKKKPAKKIIVIDSSEQSRYERSMQSGEMSVSGNKNQKQKNLKHKQVQQKTSEKMFEQKQINHNTMYISGQQYPHRPIECYQSEDKRF